MSTHVSKLDLNTLYGLCHSSPMARRMLDALVYGNLPGGYPAMSDPLAEYGRFEAYCQDHRIKLPPDTSGLLCDWWLKLDLFAVSAMRRREQREQKRRKAA